jgi:hypothetical protein
VNPALGLVAVFFLIIANGFFVAAEFDKQVFAHPLDGQKLQARIALRCQMLDLVHQSRLHFDARKGLACDGRLCIKDLEWPPLRVQRKDLNAGFVHAVGMSIGSSRRVDHCSKGTRTTLKCVKFSKRLLESEKFEFYRIKVYRNSFPIRS